MTQTKWQAYCRLMRIDKPIGSLLLLWPTYWALWLAGGQVPSLKLLVVFTLGVFLCERLVVWSMILPIGGSMGM